MSDIRELYKADPRRLTLHAKPANTKELQCFEGRVGAVVHHSQYFVTSPNTDIVLDPLLGDVSTRMRRQFNWGEDDPTLYPQPLMKGSEWLAAIPRPNPHNAEFAHAWGVLSEYHFDQVQDNQYQTWLGLGRFRTSALDGLTQLAQRVSDRARVVCKSGIEEHIRKMIVGFVNRCEDVTGRLSMPATFRDASLTVRLVQDAILEIHALCEWARYYLPVWYRQRDRDERPANAVIGAFVERPDDAALLFRLGIPLWLVRPITLAPGVRVDKYVEPPLTTHAIPFEDVEIDISDEDPPYKIVYTGSRNRARRYHEMQRFDANFGLPSVSAGSLNINVDSSAPMQSVPSSSAQRPAATKAPRDHSKVRAPKPYASTKDRPQNSYCPQPGSERPELISSASDIWTSALESAKQLPRPYTGVPPPITYAFPDPSIFTGGSTHAASYLTNWLRHRPILKYRMYSHDTRRDAQAVSRWLTNKEWRAALSSVNHSGDKTRYGKLRGTIEGLISETVELGGTGVSCDFEKLHLKPIQWKGHPLEKDVMPATGIAKEILWELNMLNFAFDFMALDKKLYNGKQTAAARHHSISSISSGLFALDPSVEDDVNDREITSAQEHRRRPFLRAMHALMVDWSVTNLPHCLRRRFPIEEDDPPRLGAHQEVLAVEREMSLFFVREFYNNFYRLPFVPRTLRDDHS